MKRLVLGVVVLAAVVPAAGSPIKGPVGDNGAERQQAREASAIQIPKAVERTWVMVKPASKNDVEGRTDFGKGFSQILRGNWGGSGRARTPPPNVLRVKAKLIKVYSDGMVCLSVPIEGKPEVDPAILSKADRDYIQRVVKNIKNKNANEPDEGAREGNEQIADQRPMAKPSANAGRPVAAAADADMPAIDGEIRAIKAWFSENLGDPTYEILKVERVKPGPHLRKIALQQTGSTLPDHYVYVKVRHPKEFGLPTVRVWRFSFSPDGRLQSAISAHNMQMPS